jgi:hypothetical protein
MTKTNTQRLIEVSLPLQAISEQSAQQKSIRHGHISKLHIWWAWKRKRLQAIFSLVEYKATLASTTRPTVCPARRSSPGCAIERHGRDGIRWRRRLESTKRRSAPRRREGRQEEMPEALVVKNRWYNEGNELHARSTEEVTR